MGENAGCGESGDVDKSSNGRALAHGSDYTICRAHMPREYTDPSGSNILASFPVTLLAGNCVNQSDSAQDPT